MRKGPIARFAKTQFLVGLVEKCVPKGEVDVSCFDSSTPPKLRYPTHITLPRASWRAKNQYHQVAICMCEKSPCATQVDRLIRCHFHSALASLAHVADAGMSW